MPYSLNIRIAGAAGQGVQTASDLVGRAAARQGLHASCVNDAESRIRGGLNFNQLRLSQVPAAGVSERIDVLLALNEQALRAYGPNTSQDGVVIGPSAASTAGLGLVSIARKAGNEKAASTASAACACALAGIEGKTLDELIMERFGDRADVNLEVARLVRQDVEKMDAAGRLSSPRPGTEDSGRLWLAGHQAIALGAVAGGASFYAGYPMSPSTGIMVNLARWSRSAGLHVEQAEDEVAAISMVAGASYAGARAMTATSGGGFCLMTEGVSLLGMIECGAVIVIAGRPGPATGLPTRAAQGDLLLALHAGHGAFPRVILAPRDIPDGIELTARAFDIAERFQVPVLILTDQLLQDGRITSPMPALEGLPRRRHLSGHEKLEALDEYRRYRLTEDGISPQAAPGVSRHVVVVDSDEHDQWGHITESAAVAAAMADKRRRKAATVAAAGPLEPERPDGDPERMPLVASWGSSYHTLIEAREMMGGDVFAHLHLRQLWPLAGRGLEQLVKKTPKLVVVESAQEGGLEVLLRRVCLRRPEAFIGKDDGRPFSVEELAHRLGEVL